MEAKTEHLPKLLCRIFNVLSKTCNHLPINDISITLKLCSKLLCKMQPPLLNINEENISEQKTNNNTIIEEKCHVFCQGDSVLISELQHNESSTNPLEFDIQSEESTKPDEIFNSIRSVISLCVEKYQKFFVTFLKEKVILNIEKSLDHYQSLLLPKKDRQVQREKHLDKLLHKCLSTKCNCVSAAEIENFKQEITDLAIKKLDLSSEEVENVVADSILCEAFERLCNLLVELSSFPTFYTNSRELYEKHLHACKYNTLLLFNL